MDSGYLLFSGNEAGRGTRMTSDNLLSIRATAVGKSTSHVYSHVREFTPWLCINDGKDNHTIFLDKIVVTNVIPEPHIQVDNHLVNEDEPIHFSASGSLDSPTDLPILTYVWDFGDGTTGVGIDVIHAFSDMGTYNVVLMTSDGKTTIPTDVQIDVNNLPPVADGGAEKTRFATEDEPVILDASGTTDTPSDMAGLNFTWKIGDDAVYGKVVSYSFVATGEFTVTLTVQDSNGASSEDTLIFQVSKVSVSDDAAMNTMSWILILVLLVLIGVIGFLFMTKSDPDYLEAQTFEDVIAIEGKIDNEMFKPRGDGIQQDILGADDQGEVSIHEEKEPSETNEVIYEEKEDEGEGEFSNETFKQPDRAEPGEHEAGGEAGVGGGANERYEGIGNR